MDRATKLHQREFEVLPEIWSKLNDAFGATQALAGGFLSIPDFRVMTEEKLELLMSEISLTEYEKGELRAAPDKAKRYPEIMEGRQLKRTDDLVRGAHVY